MGYLPLSRDADAFYVGEVSYNGVKFPPAIHSKARFSPVYDDSGRISKYVRGTLLIEAYLFPGCLETPTSFAGAQGSTADIQVPYHPAPGLAALTDGSNNDVTTDTTMLEVRHRLCEPCQRLSFSYQGSGRVILNDPRYGQLDVDNGPKPKEVSWIPLTNKMAKVTWECEFAFCPGSQNNMMKGTSETVTSAGNRNIPSPYAQFPFEVDISNAPDGTTVRTITGCIEIAQTRLPADASISNGNAHAGASDVFDMLGLEKDILSVFPLLKQFKRRQDFRLSNDRKRVDFTIVDTEIHSDESFGVGIANEDVKLSTAGSLKSGGFRRWNTSLAGTVTVAAGYPKSVGWAEISRLFHKYYLELSSKGRPPLSISGYEVEDGPITSSKTGKSYPILREISLEDDLFSRDLSFSFRWDLFVEPKDLFKATGLFQPMSASETERTNNWDKWVFSMSKVMDTAGYQQLNLTQNDDVVVSLCIPWIGPKPKTVKPPKSLKPKVEKETETTPPTYPTQEQSTQAYLYSAYDNMFWIEAINHTLNHVPLSNQGLLQEKVANTDPRLNTKLTFNQETSGGGVLPEVQVVSHRIRPTTYILHCVGGAVRLGAVPQPPNVEKYGGLAVTKFGQDIIRPYNLGGGVDVVTGNTYSVHGLIWKKSYILPGIPANAKIKSDGHPQIFV